MKVNKRKTQMLCISPSGDSNISTYIYTPEGQKIESGESLKILGFYFGRRPTAEAHLAAITWKCYARHHPEMLCPLVANPSSKELGRPKPGCPRHLPVDGRTCTRVRQPCFPPASTAATAFSAEYFCIIPTFTVCLPRYFVVYIRNIFLFRSSQLTLLVTGRELCGNYIELV